MTEATEQKEYTGEKMRLELERRGYPMSDPVLKKITDMLTALGLVQKVPRPGMADVNLVAAETVDKVERYLRARRENPIMHGVRHDAATWRMLDNNGYMRE